MAVASVDWDPTDESTAALIARLGGAADLGRLIDRVPLLRGRRVRLRALPQGISGATVFLAYPTDFSGPVPRPEVAGVIKVDQADRLMVEVDRYKEWAQTLLAADSFPLQSAPTGLARTRKA